MDRKKIVYLIAIGAVALVVICVLLAGLLDGHWPWQNDRDMGGGYNKNTTAESTTDGTQGTTGNGAADQDEDDDDDDDDEDDFDVIDFEDLLDGNPQKPTTKPTEGPTEGNDDPTEDTTESTTPENPNQGDTPMEDSDISIDF